MNALARRLRVVPSVPAPPKRKPGTWGPLSPPVDPAETLALAFWLSRMSADARRKPFALTDLRRLARAIRSSHRSLQCST